MCLHKCQISPLNIKLSMPYKFLLLHLWLQKININGSRGMYPLIEFLLSICISFILILFTIYINYKWLGGCKFGWLLDIASACVSPKWIFETPKSIVFFFYSAGTRTNHLPKWYMSIPKYVEEILFLSFVIFLADFICTTKPINQTQNSLCLHGLKLVLMKWLYN